MDEKSSSSAARIRARPARYRGQHVARDSLFINIARFLWALDIGHAIEDGKEVPIDTMATQDFNSRPMPFKASFKTQDRGKDLVVDKA